MTRNGWQLAVIDEAMVDKDKFPNLLRQGVKSLRNEVVFITSTMRKLVAPQECRDQASIELSMVEEYKHFGVPYCGVYYPTKRRYGYCMAMFLRPILSEEDAIDVETRLGVDVRRWMQ